MVLFGVTDNHQDVSQACHSTWDLCPVHPDLLDRDCHLLRQPGQLHIKAPPLQALVWKELLCCAAREELGAKVVQRWAPGVGREGNKKGPSG